ncbi:DUF2800 domain-containing protein [Methyloceanibacter caenitepidi]|uniref:Phage protein n=1 Tax=Methyloceanibacter caenitepidi TaxID=1384459 RepID=A0A0A8K244_9HYPH|nr:DUF2800 domain-containing protein [Methyloceanibacter caenitepidi]BAQ16069.1 phage protein [Methyloceanibacter caenitepidi]
MTQPDLTLPAFLDRRKGKKDEPHSARAHAKLAPSASHRWIHCPGSIKASEGIDEKSSVYANEGTAAHELAAICLKTGFDADHYIGQVVDIEAENAGTMFLTKGAPLGDSLTKFEVTDDMAENVQEYVDYVREFSRLEEDREIDVEQRLDMTHIHPECFGTGDTVIYLPKAEWLHVFDLKFGKGVVVEVEDNPQLLTYGSGAARRYHNRPLKGVTLHVIQPRAPHPDGSARSKDYDILDLLEFELDLAQAAKATEAEAAPLVAGDWCGFCPALPTCGAAREKARTAALADFKDDDEWSTEAMTPEALAKVLEEADFILTWVKSVQEYAHAEAVAGRCPTGYKLVAKRATRKWKGDEEEIKGALEIDFDLSDEDILKEPEMRSPAQLEKVVGKKAFKDIEAKLVEKVSSGTNLVAVSDKRPAVKTEGLSDFGE